MDRVLKPNGRLCLADLIYHDEDSRAKSQVSMGKFYASLGDLLNWLDLHGFIVQYKQINSMLHIILASKA